MPLLPKNREHGWAPYAWLVFLVFFYIQPVVEHWPWKLMVLTTAEVAGFLVLYFGIFWVRPPVNYFFLLGMAAMGLGLAGKNQGSSVFIIFAAAFIPWVFEKPKRSAIALLALLLAIAINALLFKPEFGFSITAIVVCLGVGGSNIHFSERARADIKLRMAHEEIEHLAKIAERERIARDLHDVLGHTLSLIIVKSTLAGKLLEQFPQRARKEIADIETASREAMAEIRNTLRGYGTYKLSDEVEKARLALQSAGVSADAEVNELAISPAQESVVALILREAVTNVVRHAQARNCRLRIARQNSSGVLEVADDGCGGVALEGNGVRGMRERIEALGGTMVRELEAGTKLRFEFPLAVNGKS
jgi:two-component system sensor histidine kinase DesK